MTIVVSDEIRGPVSLPSSGESGSGEQPVAASVASRTHPSNGNRAAKGTAVFGEFSMALKMLQPIEHVKTSLTRNSNTWLKNGLCHKLARKPTYVISEGP